MTLAYNLKRKQRIVEKLYLRATEKAGHQAPRRKAFVENPSNFKRQEQCFLFSFSTLSIRKQSNYWQKTKNQASSNNYFYKKYRLVVAIKGVLKNKEKKIDERSLVLRCLMVCKHVSLFRVSFSLSPLSPSCALKDHPPPPNQFTERRCHPEIVLSCKKLLRRFEISYFSFFLSL